MPKIYPFPTQEDRVQVIEAARLCSRGTKYRVPAMRIAAQVLRKFHAKQMYTGSLLVVDHGDFTTNLVGHNYTYPVVTFEATRMAENNVCPACGAKDWWFLSGEGISTANCGCCGAFYKIKMVKEAIAKAEGKTK